MNVRFVDKKLARLEVEPDYTAGFSAAIVRSFRERMQLIRAAADERAFYALKSLHYEKLKGSRSRQRSIRLNQQWRLILEIEERQGRTIVVIKIEDYH